MPTHKADLSALSITQLCELTGVAKETASRRLRDAGLEPLREDGRTLYYAPRLALPVLLQVGSGLNPVAEKARLDRLRADEIEHNLALKRGEVVPAGDQDHGFVALATAVSARLQAVPSAIAAEVAAEGDPAACHEILERAIHDALRDLADAGREAARRIAQAET